MLSAAPAQAGCADELAATVQAYYDSVRDFTADFEQTTRAVLFGAAGGDLSQPPARRGQVIFAKPGKMRWDYTAPEPSLMVSDGEILWLYSPILQEAQRLHVTEGSLDGALQFLLGGGKLLESFKVSSDACPLEAAREEDEAKKAAASDGGKLDPAADTIELQLTPRQPASYERLGITVRVSTGEVVATRVVDLLGNETRIAFQKIRLNQDPPSDTFTFAPGPAVEVIELGPAP